jgi:hypothetical protein
LPEFVYTGDLDVEKHLNNMDPWDFLDELLELLSISEVWNMPDLKMKIGAVIVSQQLIMPDTYNKSKCNVGHGSTLMCFQLWNRPESTMRQSL